MDQSDNNNTDEGATMGITIQTIKYGEIKEKRDWNEGRYTIGRNETCDIWLDDQHISSTHAEIDVNTDKVTIRNTSRINGIYFGDKKFESKTFKKNFEVELGPYVVKGIFQKPQKPVIREHALLQSRLFYNIRFLLTLSLILMAVLTSFIVFIILNYQTRTFQQEEFLKRGNLFSLYLAKLAGVNENDILLDADDRRLIQYISGEEGVSFAVIADYMGQILAPAGTDAKKITWDGFEDAINKEVRKSENLTENQKIIFYPIKNNGKVLGGAVIKLDMRKAGQSGMSAYFTMILFVMIILCIFIGRYVTRFFLRPLQSLGEEVSVAMKESRRRINFHSPHAEIAELSDMFNRLLQNSQRNFDNTEKTVEYPGDLDDEPNDKNADVDEQLKTADVAMHAKPSENKLMPIHQDEKTAFSCQSDTFYKNSKADKNNGDNNDTDNVASTGVISEPQCIIDVSTFIIVDCNAAFEEHFSKTSTRKNINFAEVFEDPLVSNAVYELIAGSKEKTSVTINDTYDYLIKKSSNDEKKGLITIIFKESLHV